MSTLNAGWAQTWCGRVRGADRTEGSILLRAAEYEPGDCSVQVRWVMSKALNVTLPLFTADAESFEDAQHKGDAALVHLQALVALGFSPTSTK